MGRFGDLREPAPAISRIGNLERVLRFHKGQRYGDRIYADQTLKDTLLEDQNLALYTPVKRKKGQDRLTADEKRFSQKVSRIRQHIEGLFRWRDRKTNLSVASQVRSYNG